MDGRIFQFFVVAFAGWLNRHQTAQLAYLTEENRVLRQHLGKRRLLLTDAQRRRLAAKAKAVGRRGLLQLSTIVTPSTLLDLRRLSTTKKWNSTPTSVRPRGRPAPMHGYDSDVVPSKPFENVATHSDDCGVPGQTYRYDVFDISGDGRVDVVLSDDTCISDDISRTYWRTFLGAGCMP